MSILFSTQQRLTEDGIAADLINNALTGDSEAIGEIGRQYLDKKQYGEAMKWFRLAAAKNNSGAQNDIGVMYYKGLGVPTDHITALEWLLKAAVQKYKTAYKNIGNLFENGQGVPADEYKALEWYTKGKNTGKINEFKDRAIELTGQDKDKSIEELIVETEKIFWGLRNEDENATGRIETLTQQSAKLEEESFTKDAKIISLKKDLAEKTQKLNDQENHMLSLLNRGDNQEENITSLQQQIKPISDEIEHLVSLDDFAEYDEMHHKRRYRFS